MDGLILFDKPQDLTSHDVVNLLRRTAGQRKVGHCGTLDPMATGLLIISLGKATRMFPFLSKMDKVYQGQIRFGFSTDTFDALGRPTSRPGRSYPDESRLKSAMREFTGDIDQLPPAFSAKKFQGKPLYVYARRNKAPRLTPQRVHIRSFRLVSYSPPYLDFEIECSSGTYIRSIANDLGERLGCRAHLSSLRRTRIGSYSLDKALTIDTLKALRAGRSLQEHLIPLEHLLSHCPRILVDVPGETLVKHGHPLTPEHIMNSLPPETPEPDLLSHNPGLVRLFTGSGRFLALAKACEGGSSYKPFLVVDSDAATE